MRTTKTSELANLKNIGATTARWLNAIGVYTKKDMQRLDPVDAYKILKAQGYSVSLNFVYAWHGALRDVQWNKLPTALKTELRVALADARKPRCTWPGGDPLMLRYHDQEWGVPVHDDRRHFEFLILEGAQAGLSWRTVLHKRTAYRQAFANFDPRRVARFDARKVKTLLKNAGIIRNRLKIAATITNARAFLAVQKEFGTFDQYVWRFVGGRPIVNHWASLQALPARTKLSDALSADLKKRGFRFVGSTIVYAHMQATGMVNDHVVSCFRHRACTHRPRPGITPDTTLSGAVR